MAELYKLPKELLIKLLLEKNHVKYLTYDETIELRDELEKHREKLMTKEIKIFLLNFRDYVKDVKNIDIFKYLDDNRENIETVQNIDYDDDGPACNITINYPDCSIIIRKVETLIFEKDPKSLRYKELYSFWSFLLNADILISSIGYRRHYPVTIFNILIDIFNYKLGSMQKIIDQIHKY